MVRNMLTEKDLFNNREELLKPGISEPVKRRIGYLALMAVDELQVDNRNSGRAYKREEFGIDGAEDYTVGRDRRLFVLKRDLDDIGTYYHPDRNGNQAEYVRYATYREPYTDEEQELVGAGAVSQHVNIDHVVSLKDAWNNGADRMTLWSRHELATDPDNLLAVDKYQNSVKGHAAIDQYTPDQNYAIQMCAIQALIKQRYKLTVTRREKEGFYDQLCNQENYEAMPPNRAITYYEPLDQKWQYPDSWPSGV